MKTPSLHDQIPLTRYLRYRNVHLPSHKNQRQMADKVQFHAFSETNALLALLVRLANTVPQTDGPIA